MSADPHNGEYKFMPAAPRGVVGGGSPTGAEGAWASPLAARKLHFFRDGYRKALCGAYMTLQVKPSEFAAGARASTIAAARCPTCERKLGYFGEAPRG